MSVFASKNENRFPLTFREFAHVSMSLFGAHSDLCLTRTRCSRQLDLCSTRRCRDICTHHTDSGTSRRGLRSSVTTRYVQVCLPDEDCANLTCIGQPRSRPQHVVSLATRVRLFFSSISPLANDSQDENASWRILRHDFTLLPNRAVRRVVNCRERVK